MTATLELNSEALEEIVSAIAREHQLATDAMASSVEHAIAVGDHLLAAKKLVPFGQWEDWLDAHIVEWEMTSQWARSYMRIARYKDDVRKEGLVSIGAARKFLHSGIRRDARYDPILRKECDRLHKEGKGPKEIAVEVGVSKVTVWRWLNPKREAQLREKASRNSRAGKSALKVQERKAAAKKVGGELGEGYTLIRRALDCLEKASPEHALPVRREIRSAMNSLYNAEDAVSRAIKQEYANTHGGAA